MTLRKTASVEALSSPLLPVRRRCLRASADGEGAAGKRDACVFSASDCVGCQTRRKPKGAFLAAGPCLGTRFGGFRTPNFTPHPIRDIGKWSEVDIVTFLRDGNLSDSASVGNAITEIVEARAG